MLFVPVDALVEYVPYHLLQTHLLSYAKYLTPFSSHELQLDYYTIAEYYSAAQQISSPLWAYGQLLLLGGMLSFGLALTTYFRPFWFWIAQGMFVALVYSCNLQHLRLGGRIDILPYVVLLLPFVLTSWYIHRRGSHLLLARRVLVFASLFTLVGLAVSYLSVEESPFLILSHHIYYPQLCLTILFCFFVGQEIPYLLLRLSSSVGFGKSGQQFLLIFLLYMAHLVCFFLYNTGYIDWDLYYVDEFVFLGVSVVVGLWGLQARAHLYSYLLPVVLQRIAYLVWAVFAITSIVYMRTTANDPALEVFEDSILFGHIGFGVGFLIYVLYNFYTPLFRNLAVWRIVYQPGVGTPLLAVRVVGMFVLIFCYLLSERAAYNHALSGEKLQLANLYERQSSPLARSYYEEAALYGYQSHGANYALGKYAFLEEDYYTAVSYYRTALAKHPSPHAYLNLGNTLQALKLREEALDVWKKGFSRYRSSYLANNISFYYLQQNLLDSAVYYAELAGKQAYTNLSAARALEGEPPLSRSTSLGEETNQLAAALRHRLLPTELLNTAIHNHTQGLAYMHNYVLALLRYDASLARDSLQYFGKVAKDPIFRHDLKRLEAFSEATVGHTDQALRLLDQIGGRGSQYAGFYAYTAGLWTYKMGGYSRAAEYFLKSCRLGYLASTSIGLQCTAMLPEGKLKDRQIADWKYLQADTTQYWKYVTKSPFKILEEATEVAPLLEGCANKPRLVLAFVQRLLDDGKDSLATELLRQVSPLSDSLFLTYANLLEAECLFAREDSSSLVKKLSSLPKQVPHHQYIRYLSSPEELSAEELLQKVKEYPFQQQLILRTAEALERKGHSLRAYELLLSAIETNPYAVALQQAYIWQAIRLGQTTYAEDALTDLQTLMPTTSYVALLGKYRSFVRQQDEIDKKWK